jgi:hypothetical protein
MKTSLIMASVLMLSISACGRKSSGSSPAAVPAPTPAPVPTVTVDPYHTRPLEITQKEDVAFVRQEQMTSRYNCDGTIRSRKIETIDGLSKKITVDYENRKEAWDYAVYNRRTENKNSGFGTMNGNFMVDYAPTVYNMRVKEGINEVEYVFYRCTKVGKKPNGEKICLGTVEVEKEGMVQIDVTYSSVTLPGERHIHPYPESCKPKA